MGQQDSYQTYHRESSLVAHDSRVMMILLKNIFISLKVFHSLIVHSLILNMEFALENLQQLAKQKLIKKIAHFGFMWFRTFLGTFRPLTPGSPQMEWALQQTNIAFLILTAQTSLYQSYPLSISLFRWLLSLSFHLICSASKCIALCLYLVFFTFQDFVLIFILERGKLFVWFYDGETSCHLYF